MVGNELLFVQVRLLFCLTKQTLLHENVRGMNFWTYVFLTSGLFGCDWSASHPGHFIPLEINPSIRWIGGWVGLRRFGGRGEVKFLTLPGLELRLLGEASRCADCATAALALLSIGQFNVWDSRRKVGPEYRHGRCKQYACHTEAEQM